MVNAMASIKTFYTHIKNIAKVSRASADNPNGNLRFNLHGYLLALQIHCIRWGTTSW